MNEDSLTIRLRKGEGYAFVKLRGVIDEDNNLSRTLNKLNGNLLIIDTSEIKRINSCGVRDWINWLSEIENREFRVALIRCSPAIIAQINLVTNFVGDGIVYSFFAPYYCRTCSHEHNELLRTDHLLDEQHVKAPPLRCNQCGTRLEFDDIPEAYFAFLSSTDTEVVDHRTRRLLEEVSPSLEEKIRALNEQGTVSDSGSLQTLGTESGTGREEDMEGSTPSRVKEKLGLDAPPYTNRTVLMMIISTLAVIGLLIALSLDLI